jgi:hypothetical protein
MAAKSVCWDKAEQQILHAYPTSWGPKRADSQDDTALGSQEQWTREDISSQIVAARDVLGAWERNLWGVL